MARERWSVAFKHYHIEKGTDVGVVQGLYRLVNTWLRAQPSYHSGYRPLQPTLANILFTVQERLKEPRSVTNTVEPIMKSIIVMVNSLFEETRIRCDEKVAIYLANIAVELSRLNRSSRMDIIKTIQKIYIIVSLSEVRLERWVCQTASQLSHSSTRLLQANLETIFTRPEALDLMSALLRVGDTI